MASRLQAFNEVRYTSDCQGYPCIASVGQNEVVVGDWSGNLLRAMLTPFTVQNKAFVASKIDGELVANSTLCSLVPASGVPSLYAVATGSGHAAVWDSSRGSVILVVPQDGSVHSVAWLRGADYLLLGTGHYALDSSSKPQAWLELWSVKSEEPSLLARIALPGACVDAIAVCEDNSNQIVCFSGMKSQVQGFLSILDADSLLPQAVFDLPFVMVRHLECTEDSIFFGHGCTVRAVSRDDGRERWVHKLGDGMADFAYDANFEQLLLSNGNLISARKGQVVETWPALADCCCVRPRPEGGFVGISKAGVIGVWNVNS
jgi:hypothetical protein